MSQSRIPDDVSSLIAEHIPSVERLEILLVLYEGNERSWTVEELEERIRSRPDSIRKNVSALIFARIVFAEGTYPWKARYQPATEALGQTVAALAVLYRERRVAIIEMIYADRNGDARSFSDAFKLSKPHDR